MKNDPKYESSLKMKSCSQQKTKAASTGQDSVAAGCGGKAAASREIALEWGHWHSCSTSLQSTTWVQDWVVEEDRETDMLAIQSA